MSNSKLKFPIGMQSFQKLREDGYTYIDKTRFIPLLLEKKYYFLSRPRRFGKSLLLSTLEAYFQGKKELFEGLDICSYEQDWIEYPVVHIDFNIFSTSNPSSFVNDLRFEINNIAASHHIKIKGRDDLSIGMLFAKLIDSLHKQYTRDVVILIDEYDKGILEMLQDEALLEEITDELRPFFDVLKSNDKHIKFALITGVSRFRNTTLFSGFNNPSDITLDGRFSSILGITQVELEKYFGHRIDLLAEEYGYSHDKTLQLLKDKYDGYRFSRREEYVYNPFSLLCALDSLQLEDFWVATGSSKMLAKYVSSSNFDLEEMTSRRVSGTRLGSTYSEEDPLSLFYQTGYLTIRNFRNESYQLGIPNQEVQTALTELIIPEFAHRLVPNSVEEKILDLKSCIFDCKVDRMMKILQSILSSVPYQIIDKDAQEKHLHLCIYLIFLMVGTSAKCEVCHAGGRVDMVAYTPWHVYIFEFKLDKSPEDALRQIDDKGYSLPWVADGRKIIKIGVEFSSKLHTIENWQWTSHS